MAQPKPLTTGQAARICRVTPRVVVKWLDSGLLPGWTIPGSSHRRIEREALAEFMARAGMPAEWIEEGRAAA